MIGDSVISAFAITMSAVSSTNTSNNSNGKRDAYNTMDDDADMSTLMGNGRTSIDMSARMATGDAMPSARLPPSEFVGEERTAIGHHQHQHYTPPHVHAHAHTHAHHASPASTPSPAPASPGSTPASSPPGPIGPTGPYEAWVQGRLRAAGLEVQSPWARARDVQAVLANQFSAWTRLFPVTQATPSPEHEATMKDVERSQILALRAEIAKELQAFITWKTSRLSKFAVDDALAGHPTIAQLLIDQWHQRREFMDKNESDDVVAFGNFDAQQNVQLVTYIVLVKAELGGPTSSSPSPSSLIPPHSATPPVVKPRNSNANASKSNANANANANASGGWSWWVYALVALLIGAIAFLGVRFARASSIATVASASTVASAPTSTIVSTNASDALYSASAPTSADASAFSTHYTPPVSTLFQGGQKQGGQWGSQQRWKSKWSD